MEHWSRELGLGLELNVHFLLLIERRNPKLFQSSPTLVLLMRGTGFSPVHGFFSLGGPLPLGISRLDGGGESGGWWLGGR